MLWMAKRHKGKEMNAPMRNKRRKFSALNEIAKTKKKGNEASGHVLGLETGIDGLTFLGNRS